MKILSSLKSPVNTLADLYSNFLDGGQSGWFTFAGTDAKFYYWNGEKWEELTFTTITEDTNNEGQYYFEGIIDGLSGTFHLINYYNYNNALVRVLHHVQTNQVFYRGETLQSIWETPDITITSPTESDVVVINELQRYKNEQQRKTNELERIDSEILRETTEGERQTTFTENEAERQSTFEGNETTRQENEITRANSENDRISAEEARETAEGLRETNTSTAIQNAENATVIALAAAENAPKPITLLSITTAPDPNDHEVGDKYYNSTDKLIYTISTAGDEWDNGVSPRWQDIYQFNGLKYAFIANNMLQVDKGVIAMVLVETTGLTKHYRMAYTDGTWADIYIENGNGIASILRTSGNGAAGTTDTYTITFIDASTTTFQVVNGANGTGATVANTLSGDEADKVPSVKTVNDVLLDRTSTVNHPSASFTASAAYLGTVGSQIAISSDANELGLHLTNLIVGSTIDYSLYITSGYLSNTLTFTNSSGLIIRRITTASGAVSGSLTVQTGETDLYVNLRASQASGKYVNVTTSTQGIVNKLAATKENADYAKSGIDTLNANLIGAIDTLLANNSAISSYAIQPNGTVTTASSNYQIKYYNLTAGQILRIVFSATNIAQVASFSEANHDHITSLLFNATGLIFEYTAAINIIIGVNYSPTYYHTAYIRQYVSMPLYSFNQVKELKSDVDALKSAINTEIDYPSEIFAIDNDSAVNSNTKYNRELANSIYPESICKVYSDLLFSGVGRKKLIYYPSKNSTTKQTYVIASTLQFKGYADKAFNVNLIKTKLSNISGKKVFALGIGDSFIELVRYNLDGTLNEKGSRIGSLMSSINAEDCKDLNISKNLTSVGHRLSETIAYNYNGNAISFNSYGEAKSSWAMANFMRHPILLTGGFGNPIDSTASIYGNATWYILGLSTKGGTQTAVDYERYNASQVQAMMTTPFGKYPIDYHANIWDSLKYFTDCTEIYGNANAWTGSQAQKDLINAYFARKVANPDNPFYDSATVISSGGSHAFSVNKWLERYRTLDDNGVRLYTDSVGGTTKASGSQVQGYYANGTVATGYMVGSLVTNTLSYDVCKPTHIYCGLGINDYFQFGGSVDRTIVSIQTQVLADFQTMQSVINTQISTAHFGAFSFRPLGAFKPSMWADKSTNVNLTDISGWIDRNIGLKTLYGNIADSNKKNWYIPIYHIQALSGGGYSHTVKSFDGDENIIVSDNVDHPDLNQYKSVAYQILSWIYYTI